ncbi:MAG: poly-gamma-glutamate hydrolase family protein [Terriglobales bacterium]|jgi:phage replication-related protein YjqB (UPF0714/DUF867 family)
MADRYKNFADLAAHEKENSDFRVRSEERHGAAAIIAPHGGGIEPGTSELAEAIAGADLSFYAFEGLKKNGNGVLHITSSRFDEPKAVVLVNASPRVVVLHGELDCRDQVVFLGGLDERLGKRIQAELQAAGFVVRIHDDPYLQGVEKSNICNRGQSGEGVQLELSQPLRRSCFPSFDRNGRQQRTEQGDRFVEVMRKALLGDDAGAIVGEG